MADNTDSSKGKNKVVMAEPLIKWLTIILNGERYAINVMQVKEVLKHINLAPVPGAPDYVCGIINLRGKVVTVIDTKKRFGLPMNKATTQERIVIIEAREQVVGIVVDNVADVIELDREIIEPAPNVGNKDTIEFIEGVCEHNNELLVLIDIDKILTDKEWEEMSGL